MATSAHSTTITPGHNRRVARAVALLAAAAAVVAALALPVNASARTCPTGDFCIYENANFQGGWYHWSGPDRDLLRNQFQDPKTGERTGVNVGNNGSSVFNAGSRDFARDDVLVFDGSLSLCIPRGTGVKALINKESKPGATWNNSIERFKWVASC